jgi:hypothetical protein
VREKGKAALLTARIMGHYVGDRLGPAKRTARLGKVPASPAVLTPEWLTAALCADHPAASVTSVEVTGGSDGTSSRRSLVVTYNEAGSAAGLPTHLFTKSTATLTTRIVCGLCHLLANESGFYNHIRPALDMSAPHGYHAVYDPKSFRSLFILEDVATTRGATFGSPVDRVLSRDQAEDVVRQLAAYHGALWDDPRLTTEFTWLLTAFDWHTRMNNMINTSRMFRNGIPRAEAVIPDELLDRRDELWPALMRSTELHARAPHTLVHADVHAGNWFVTADGGMGLYDWQCTVRGNWALDFAYALMSGLSIESRREWEEDLLRLYLEELKAAGGEAPGFDEAWLQYRQQVFHGLFAWVGTIGAGRMQPEMQPRDICLANIERITQAVVDLKSLDALNES